jgi:hypothetical protein
MERKMKMIDSKRNFNLLFIGAIIILLAGCGLKVKLVGQYDEIIDKAVHQAESDTTAHIKKIIDNNGTGDGAYDKNIEFYSKMKGDVQALIVRSETIEDGLKSTPLTDNFMELQKQYDDLEILHQTPFNANSISSAQKAFDQSYRAIVKHMIYMKWNQEKPKSN